MAHTAPRELGWTEEEDGMQGKIIGVSALLAGLLASPAFADPPAHPSVATSCTVALPTGTFVASFDDSMSGKVTVDGAAGTRRFKVKSTPYSATYMLIFQAYDAGDRKPPSETLTAGKSIVARLVMVGSTLHLYFDSDYNPPGVRATLDGFVCK
jgi:hypothetical protein